MPCLKKHASNGATSEPRRQPATRIGCDQAHCAGNGSAPLPLPITCLALSQLLTPRSSRKKAHVVARWSLGSPGHVRIIPECAFVDRRAPFAASRREVRNTAVCSKTSCCERRKHRRPLQIHAQDRGGRRLLKMIKVSPPCQKPKL